MESKDIGLGQPVLCQRPLGRVISAVVLGINPANDGGPEDEVRLQFTDGRDEWVRLDAVGPMPQTLHPGWLRVGQDLADYGRLRQAVRRFLIAVRDRDGAWTQGVSHETFAAMLEMRRGLGIGDEDPLEG